MDSPPKASEPDGTPTDAPPWLAAAPPAAERGDPEEEVGYAPVVLAFALLTTALAAAPAAAAPDAASAPACAVPAPLSALEAALSGVEAAWGVDEGAFARGMDSMRAALRCAAAPVPAAVAARVHRVEGLAAFLERDAARARAAFAGARAADPQYSFPTEMVPAQNPVRVAYDAATPGTSTRSMPPPARSVAVYVDGTAARVLPADRAAVVQVEAAGTMTSSAWVLPGAPLPSYRARGEGLRVPALIGAGVLAAGTGVLWALAADARTDTKNAPSYAEMQERQGPANALAGATVAGGVATVATGVGAFVFARW